MTDFLFEAIPWTQKQAVGDLLWAQANIITVHAAMAGYSNYDVERVLSAGAALVAAERERQAFVKGYTAAWDEANRAEGVLVDMSGAVLDDVEYALVGDNSSQQSVALVKAAALLVAELDRRLFNGSAFICSRCGDVWDGKPALSLPKDKKKMKLGEKAVCQDCAEAESGQAKPGGA